MTVVVEELPDCAGLGSKSSRTYPVFISL